jgi:hypothetical protein
MTASPWIVFALGVAVGLLVMSIVCGLILKRLLNDLLQTYRDELEVQESLHVILREYLGLPQP